MKITKIQGGYICEGKNFNLLAFTLTDLLTQLQSMYSISISLFNFKNLN